jgi:Nif-specific regulatory protein
VKGLIGRSEAIARVLKLVSNVAPLDVSVLVLGPTGVGKTQLARIIHENGPRAARPFVELSCGSISESLIESDLFGYVKGAFTGAARDTPGKIAAAQGGTLFLDEVSSLSLSAQAKLLQLLQSKEYFPVGSTKAVHADVRIIAAANNLEMMVAERKFREDLYFRLRVMQLRVPSLAERREDIPELVTFFCEQVCERFQFPHLEPSLGMLRAAQAAEWEGNVRDLAAAVQQAVVLAAGDRVQKVERAHLFPEQPEPGTERQLTYQEATRIFQGQLLKKTLEETNCNVSETAARLDLTRSHVYNLIEAHRLGSMKPRKPPKS